MERKFFRLAMGDPEMSTVDDSECPAAFQVTSRGREDREGRVQCLEPEN